MAAPDLRIVRRPKGSLVASAAPGRTLVAASAPVDDPTKIFQSAGLGGRRSGWQDEAWELYDAVGEFGFYIRCRARACSRVKLVASEIDPETGQPTGSIAEDNAEGAKVAEIVRSIAGGPLGQAELIERAIQVLGVPGEFWCAVIITDEGERWLAVSREELHQSQRGRDTVDIDLPEGGKHTFNPGKGDGMFRVWNSHARKASEPDSPARSNLGPLREIERTTRKIENADNSRMANNGLLLIPQEASLPSAAAPVSANKPGADPDEPQPQRPTARALQALIIEVNREGAKSPNSPESMIPIVAAVPGEHVDKIKHVTFGKDLSDSEIRKRNDAIARLAMGVDMEADQLLGLSNVNHWNAFISTDQDVNKHIKPVMKTFCQALYRNVIRPMLVRAGIDPVKYVLWFDAAELTADPDKTDEAKDANTAGALKNAALLRHLGLPEDDGYDLTTLEGLQELARDKVAKAEPAQFVQVIREVLPLLDPAVQAIDFPEPVALPPANDTEDDDEESGAERGEEPDTEDEQAASARVGDGLSMAVELMVTRCLELAGKRRFNINDPVQKARLRDVPAHEYHRYMAPVAEDQVGKLIKGWDAGLDELATRYGLNPDQVRLVVAREARRKLTAQVVDGEVG